MPSDLPLGVAQLPNPERHRPRPHSLHAEPRRASLGVGVRATGEKQIREVLVAVDHGHEQRSGAVRAPHVHVGPGREQGPDAAQAPLASGEQERRGAAPRARANIGAARDEGLDHPGVPFGRRPHQGRLPVPRLLCVDVGAGVRQHRDGRDLPGARGQHQRRLVGPHRLPRVVRVGAGREQPRDDRRVAVARREGQRRYPIAVRSADIRPGPDQGLCRLGVVAVHGPVERRCTVPLHCVGVHPLRQQYPHGLPVAPLRGVGER